MAYSNGNFQGGTFNINGDTGQITPNASPVSNVYENMGWKLPGDVSEIPYIEVKASQLTSDIHLENINAIVQGVADGKSDDPYTDVYKTEAPEFWFILPYILTSNSEVYNTQQDWRENTADIGSMAAGIHIPQSIKNSSMVNKAASWAKGAYNAGSSVVAGAKIVSHFRNHGTSTEPISMYFPTGASSISINFPLYNTISTSQTDSHFQFITLFNGLCLKRRTSFYTYEFPYIFEIRSWEKGGVYMPKAFCQQFSVKGLGPGKAINGRLTPEAYIVSITFTELIPNSRNIFAAAMTGGSVGGG